MAQFDVLNIPENKPKTHISEFTTFMYAPPKFGKSTFASMFGNVLLLAFEPGYNVIKVKPADIPDWKWFIKRIVDPLEKAYLEGMQIPYDTIAFDTVDKASSMCKDYVCRREGIAHESDLEWGKGYAYIKEEFEKQVLRLTKVGCGVIFLSHSEIKLFKPKNKPEFTKMMPSIPKGAREVLLPLCDFILYGDMQTSYDENGEIVETRILNCRETSEFEAGSRLKYMSANIDFGTTPEEGYENFMDSFNEAISKQFNNVEPIKTAKSAKKESKAKKTVEEVNEIKSEAAILTTDLSLESVVKEIMAVSSRLHQDKIMSSSAIANMVKEYTGVQRISGIDDLDSAVKLLNALKEAVAA